MFETVFFKHLSKDKEKLEIFKNGLLSGAIEPFQPDVISRLRRVYYSFYSGILYLYGEDTTFRTIGSKMEILSWIFAREDYTIVHGHTDSTREICFLDYQKEHLDFNSWVEVTRGGKTFVYDTFSMLCFEKDIYYELEHPEITRKSPKEVIMRHPAKFNDEHLRPDTAFWLFLGYIPNLMDNIDNHPYKDILLPEITRYKNLISYDEEVTRWKEEVRQFYK